MSKEVVFSEEKRKYLELLSRTYPNVNKASSAIINKQAELNMPRGTEHFVSDIHGEYESFGHVLRNGSGVIKNYIEELFGSTLMESEKKLLATLVYYPTETMKIAARRGEVSDNWCQVNLFRLLRICKRVSSKYTRAKVRQALPKDFSYILEELIHEDADRQHKHDYYHEIINTIIRLDKADEFVVAISLVIQRLAVEHLHVIGDIFDRGAGADKVMGILTSYHSVDYQWGNHDISWMGAGLGSEALICNVIRISARYNNLHTIEEGYGINLVPLATFAMETYGTDPCTRFYPTIREGDKLARKELDLIARMHKAVTVIQLKLEAGIILRHPEYEMDDRVMLDKLDLSQFTVFIGNRSYPLCDTYLPTINPACPLELTPEEQEVVDKIKASFINNGKLRYHIRALMNQGGMYKVSDGNLLFHGCIPLEQKGVYKATRFCGEPLAGKELLDRIEAIVQKGYLSGTGPDREQGLDLMWYLWCGADSPLYGKDKMTTFERYFTDAYELYEEGKDPYYILREEEGVCRYILESFGLDPSSGRIINGHVPVKVSKGESPVKASGRLIVIDGGFARAYQPVTGIAGYTLISNSHGMLLAAHEPFESIENAIQEQADIISSTEYIERYPQRCSVENTDYGRGIMRDIHDLEQLLYAFRQGWVKERTE